MKRFHCPSCAQEVYFENTLCLACASPLVFDPTTATMEPPRGQDLCGNRQAIGCNWRTRAGDSFCASCAMNAIVPDLSVPRNVQRWAKIEQAKRRLVYSLLRLGLPLETPTGRALRFRFLAPVAQPDGTQDPVLTGHENGTITLNVAEADDALREATRVAMGEPYRTLLGHFRHESGHFYWDVLVKDQDRTDRVDAIFGDHGQDYDEALRHHYAEGAPADWAQSFVSAYATAHPWEDFAETWAHMLHIVDGVETAGAFRISQASAERAYDPDARRETIRSWLPISLAMNAMSRSMGHADFYPFQTPPAVLDKLDAVIDLVHGARSSPP